MKTGYASLRPESQATPALGKKEHAEKGVSRLRARPTLRALDQRSLLGKRRKTFSNRQRRGVTYKLQFINEKTAPRRGFPFISALLLPFHKR